MTFNVWTFLLQAINFAVLAYVLHRLLYRPLREAIERRQAAHEKARRDADQARQEALSLRGKLEAELAATEQQRQEAVRKAVEEAEAERRRILDEGQTKLQKQREESRQALAREREEALKAVRASAIHEAVELTRRLLHEAADADLHQQLAQRLVESLEQLPMEEQKQLRERWRPDDGVVLETAEPLNGAVLRDLTGVLTTLLGQAVTPAVQARPNLISGVRLRVGGQVWDASLAGQLEDAGRVQAEEDGRV
jgi:F-type H+-transporting ATPase subunit b